MSKLFSLDGKVALVTGASRGLGRAMALGLAEAGAHVVVNGRNEAGIETTMAALAAAGRPATAMVCSNCGWRGPRVGAEGVLVRSGGGCAGGGSGAGLSARGER